MQIKASNGSDLDTVLLVDASGAPYSAASYILPLGTNRSGTITTGTGNGISSAKTLAPANTSRTSLTGQNISSNDLWLSETGTAAIGAAGSYKIIPGDSFSVVTQRAITVIGTVDGQAWTATET